jgi:hypothetical protein
MRVYVMLRSVQQEYQGERAMDEQIAVTFDVASIVWIEVNEMGVKGESGEAEQKGAVRCEDMGEVGIPRGYEESVNSAEVCQGTHDPNT